MQKYLLVTLLCLMTIIPSALCQDDNDDNVAAPNDVNVQDLLNYNRWRYNNKRIYLNEEEQIYRQLVFFENLKRIADHSQSTDATYEVALNQFSDMTDEEFKHRILNRKLKNRNTVHKKLGSEDPAVSNKVFPTPPASVDWRNKGVLNPVKNQGSCGSCWTFATAGILESFNQIKNKKLQIFSEQQLVDCVHVAGFPNSDGCDGGLQEEGVRYAIKYGIVNSSSYPYVGYQGRCRVTSPTSSKIGFYPKKFQPIQPNSADLKAALAFSPVSVSVDASTWNYYYRGVFNGCQNVTYDQLNHAVIAVGYDAQGNWIVRNSWGTSWGESGYIRLAPGNTCGVLLDNLVVTE